MLRRRRKWRNVWLRPRLRWVLVGLLASAVLAGAASANLISVSRETIAHTSHVAIRLLGAESHATPFRATRSVTPSASQYVSNSSPKPGLGITEIPAAQTITSGEDATLSISITNTGNVTLHGVVVANAVCGRSIGVLGPGDGLAYTCVLVGVTAGSQATRPPSATHPPGRR